jgi:hypothetical protein
MLTFLGPSIRYVNMLSYRVIYIYIANKKVVLACVYKVVLKS